MAASIRRLDAVFLLLLVSQRVVAMSFLADNRIHSALFYDIFLLFVTCIKEQVLSFVLLFNEGFDNI